MYAFDWVGATGALETETIEEHAGTIFTSYWEKCINKNLTRFGKIQHIWCYLKLLIPNFENLEKEELSFLLYFGREKYKKWLSYICLSIVWNWMVGVLLWFLWRPQLWIGSEVSPRSRGPSHSQSSRGEADLGPEMTTGKADLKLEMRREPIFLGALLSYA